MLHVRRDEPLTGELKSVHRGYSVQYSVLMENPDPGVGVDLVLDHKTHPGNPLMPTTK